VDLDVAAVVVVDRAQRAGAAGGDRLVVGEDVVDLVATGAARGRASKTSSEPASGSNSSSYSGP
jgi:non-canonical (house-cleaning) NTP pyrophosphatase